METESSGSGEAEAGGMESAALMAEYAAHARLYSADVLEIYLAEIESLAESGDTSWDTGPRIAGVVRQAIEARRPFSMVRVGDGTGNLLGYRLGGFERLRAHARSEILRVTFGDDRFSEAEIDWIGRGLREAMGSADVLGVSDRFRLNRLRMIDRGEVPDINVRGFSGSRESYVAVSEIMKTDGIRPPWVVSNHMHRFLAPHMEDILRGLDSLCLIGPYDLAERVKARFSVKRVASHIIPNQHSSSGAGRRWFPDDYADLAESIDPVRNGQVHLVAAGLLAKPLCHLIKSRGGIAIDIGSLIDVWAGRGVRPYQDQAYLAAYAL